ncbi:unnamed protein product [Cuscuta epithymum]|uniref:RNA helicase n=2 Tax=Cuscuta epithymum TaxID=186058 RepID=A0AAV0EJC8_9ASTE|nr:unnamed protein product [Cuscuta epithymum]
MAETASSPTPRFAPDDPSLPKPWRGLVDGKTGYLYYWNPETNVTQYDKPGYISSSVQKSSQGPHRDSDDDRYSRGYRASSKGSGREDSKTERNNSDHYRGVSDTTLGANGASVYKDRSSSMGRELSPDSHRRRHEVSVTTERNNSDHYRGISDTTLGANGASVYKDRSSSVGRELSPDSYRRRHEVSVTGDYVPPPFTSFSSTGFPSEILREVHQAGFSTPTPIQAQSWPIVLHGRDIVAIAKTGSGKTLGYLIPGFIHLKEHRKNPRLGPTVLVLSPTRELATQIQDEAVKFSKSYQISCTCLYGGAPKGPQLRDIDRGVDIVVATPGRLNDILEMRRISLHQVSYLVLDEADRMLDMGFEPQIRKIVKEVPARRQTIMFTATWPKEVRKIAADLLLNPVQVNIGNVDELVANKSITQYVEVLSQTEKTRRLEHILRSQEPGSKVIIFCSTKKMCNALSGNLARQFGAAAIHGDKSQGERDYVLSQFRTGRTPILVATDVAARGLDIKDIRVVINYDFPTGIEDYVHRIGRTGRAGATGVAYTFFTEQDGKHTSDLIKVLEGANQRVPVELRDIGSRSGGMGRGRRQWGSGPAGRDGGHIRYDSGNGARGTLAMSSSSRGGGRGVDRDSSYRHGRTHDSNGFGNYQNPRSLINGAHNSDRHGRSRSRSPVRGAASGWGGSDSRSRARSRSIDRFSRSTTRDVGRNFREAAPVTTRAGASLVPSAKQRPPPTYDYGPRESNRRSYDYNSNQKHWERSSPAPKEQRSGKYESQNSGDEEEGIFHPPKEKSNY